MDTDLFTKRYHPPGTAPGTLTERRRPTGARPTIPLMDHTDAEPNAKEIAPPLGCRPYLERSTTTWIHVQGDVDATGLNALGEISSLYSLGLEDVHNTSDGETAPIPTASAQAA